MHQGDHYEFEDLQLCRIKIHLTHRIFRVFHGFLIFTDYVGGMDHLPIAKAHDD